jgi:outer membrane protein assembly factor BamB
MGNQTASTVTFANGTTALRIGYSATGANPDASNPSTVIAGFYNDILLCRNGSLSSMGRSFYGNSYSPYTYFGVNLNSADSTFGNIMWMQTYPPAPGNLTVLDSGVDPVARVFYESYKELPEYVAYSMNTGQKLWGPTTEQPALDYYGNDFGGDLDAQCAYGNLYSVGFAGILYCYNETNGQLEWTYGNGGTGNSTYAGLNTFYGDYPTFIQAIGNGIVYTDTTEHTITDPIYKGALTRAINATTGQEIWTLPAYTGGGTNIGEYAIADGYTTFFNGYDDQIYVVGQGPSATTVTAPNAGLSFGQSAIIQGTVMDVSAGTKQTQQAADFPNGVPVASDASITSWMSYVYQQQPMPTNFTGVPVTINVVDANGNYRTIGTATTDATGTFSLTWTPDIPGSYTVTANFVGTNGYWQSSAETHFTVMQAAPTASPYPVVNLPPTEMYITAATAAIIIAIAIGFAITILVLRKRP